MANAFKLGRAVNTPLGFGNPDLITVADFDNDGDGDVATASPAGSKFQLGVFRNDGDQTFTEATLRNDLPKQVALASADLNGDGNADLVQASSDNQSATVLFGDGTGRFPTRTQVATTHDPKAITIADMDADGNRDLVIGTNNRGGVNVFLGDGQGGFTEAAGLVENVTRTTTVATGDFNNDGDLDVLAHGDGRFAFIQLLAGDGQGGFTIANTVDVPPESPRGRDLVARDFDDDGNLDWAIAKKNPDEVEVFFGDGQGRVARQSTFETDFGPTNLQAADFNRDGQTDLAVMHRDSDTVRLYDGARDGSFTLAEDAAVNGDLDELVLSAAGDLDGDGFPDIALSNNGDGGDLSVLENLAGRGLPDVNVDLQWTRQIGTDAQDKVIDTAVTSTGDLVVVSREKIRSGDDRVAVEKYDAQGNEVWSRDFGNSYTSVNAVELDAQDNIYFTGEIDLGQIGSLANHFSTLNSGTGNFNGSDPYVAKFSSQGEQEFFERFGSPDVDGDVTDLAVRDDGTAYVTARASGPFTPAQTEPAPTNDVVVSAFSSGGDLAWSRMIGAGGNEKASKIALDPSTGDLIVAGRSDAAMSSLAIGGGDDFTTTPPFSGQADNQHQGFLLRLDPGAEGRVTAVRQFELRQGADSIDGLNVDGQGRVTVVGDASDEGLESGRGTPLVNGIQIPYARRFDSDFGDAWTRQDNSRNDAFIGQDGHSDVTAGPGGFTYVSGGTRAHTSVYTDDGRLLADVTDAFFSQADKPYDDGITTISADGMSLYVGGGTTNAWAGPALGEKDGWLARLEISLTEPAGPDLDVLSLDTSELVGAMYVAWFGRAPAQGGADFWAGEIARAASSKTLGQTVKDIAESFRVGGEAKTAYPVLESAEPDPVKLDAFVTDLYGNLFDRAPSESGLAFWTGQIEQRLAADQPIGDIVFDIVSGAQNDVMVDTDDDGAGDARFNDAATALNRIEVAAAHGERVTQADFDRADSLELINSVATGTASRDAALGAVRDIAAGRSADVAALDSDAADPFMA